VTQKRVAQFVRLGLTVLVSQMFARRALLERHRLQISLVAKRAVPESFCTTIAAVRAKPESTPSPVGLLASTARAATRQLGLATALPAVRDSKRTQRRPTATNARSESSVLDLLAPALRALLGRYLRLTSRHALHAVRGKY
jgi:hypothetical protein